MAALENKTRLLLRVLEDKQEAVDYELVKQLLKEGADPLSNSALLLFTTIEQGDYNLLHLLLGYSNQRKELFESRDQDGLNVLQLASKLGRIECTSLLLSNGFKLSKYINSRCKFSGNTALLLACLMDHSAVTKLLLENGANPNIGNHREQYPVHVATIHGSIALLQELRACKGDMKVKNRLGETVLHLSRHPLVAEFLHECGVSAFQRNKAGRTALECAQERNASTDLLKTLHQLELKERRLSRVKDYGRLTKTVYRLKWFIGDIIQHIGWKATILVVIVIVIIAWTLTVYIHGVNPLFTKTITVSS